MLYDEGIAQAYENVLVHTSSLTIYNYIQKQSFSSCRFAEDTTIHKVSCHDALGPVVQSIVSLTISLSPKFVS